jgi:hypothetical protein
MNQAKRKVPAQKLSISVPEELKPLIRQRAESLDLTVSQYIRRLVSEESQVKPLTAVVTK